MVILRENDNDFVQNIGRFLEGLPHKWKVIELEIDEIGAVVENI